MNTYTSLASTIAICLDNFHTLKTVKLVTQNPPTFDLGVIGSYIIHNDLMTLEEADTLIFKEAQGIRINPEEYVSLYSCFLDTLMNHNPKLKGFELDLFVVIEFMYQNQILADKEIESLEQILRERKDEQPKPPKIDDDFVFIDEEDN